MEKGLIAGSQSFLRKVMQAFVKIHLRSGFINVIFDRAQAKIQFLGPGFHTFVLKETLSELKSLNE